MPQTITLAQFQAQLKRILATYPERKQELLTQAGELLLDNAADITDEDEGRLKASYNRIPWNGEKEWVLDVEDDQVTAGTDVFYARMVEEGHKLVRVVRRVKRGRRVYRIKEDLGFVPGKHYFRRAFEQTERELPDMVVNFMRELGKEMGFDVKG
jgi:hypothetical protein